MPRFDQPVWLFVLLLAAPLLVFGWRAMASTDPLRRAVVIVLRLAIVVMLALMLAGLHLVRQHDHLTVIGLLDVSGSVQRFANLPAIEDLNTRSNVEYLRRWFRQATQTREPDDRFGLVVFDGRAIAVSAPTRGPYVDDNLDVSMIDGTNIAEAVRLGLAMFPADTARRLVLVTDGNETAGSVLEAVKQTSRRQDVETSKVTPAESHASGFDASAFRRFDVSIDVLPIAYRVTGDVQVARIETVPVARPGQTITVRIIMDAAAPTTGLLTLRREGVPVDINGSEQGDARHVALPAGQSVHLAQVTLGQTPVNRFEAVFEPDMPADDILPDNNRAEAFTATPSKGSVLIVHRKADQPHALAAVLQAADIPVVVQSPLEFPADLLSFQNYDLIVLDDIAASELSTSQQQLISAYVRDLGGGLVMTGGENSFGAGGWNGTPVAELLPVELDPPRELRVPSGALVLVLDKSGSMNQPVAGARASQQAVANEGAALAIESLRSDSLVGVVTFDMAAHTVVPLQPNDDAKSIANRVRSIQAEGGTNMEPALQRAYEMLRSANVAKKRVVCLTDGRSHDTNLQPIAKAMADANIQLSTIAVGDDTDDALLEELAQIGGGEFRSVRDPRILPRVLIDSVQILNKPLIKETPFAPKVLATGSTLTIGMDAASDARMLGGLVITAPRSDPHAVIEMVSPDDEPLLAHWQSGLGRVAAFTSDALGKWSASWIDWPEAAAFWVQLVRTMARPTSNPDAEIAVTLADDRLNVSLDLSGEDEAGAAYVQAEGAVYRPDGSSTPIKLRQTAPGHFEGAVEAQEAGNYVVALNPRQGQRRLSPIIGGASKSTSPEFRKYQSNLAVLEDIVEQTNGRRLNIEQPLAVDLFDRQGMPPSVSSLPAWRTLLWWTIALVLLDVAARRIAWNAQTIRNAARRLIERVTPAQVRGAKVTATLATLRKVSQEVDERQEADAAGIDRFKGTGKIKPPPERRFAPSAEPSQKQVVGALDLLMGKAQASKQREPEPPSTSEAEVAAPGSTETTSGLLAAKRRARKQMEE